jgi:hypothetical protein
MIGVQGGVDHKIARKKVMRSAKLIITSVVDSRLLNA